MQFKSLITGLLIGALMGAAGMYWYGDKLRSKVADTKKEIGKSVEQAGDALKSQADKLK